MKNSLKVMDLQPGQLFSLVGDRKAEILEFVRQHAVVENRFIAVPNGTAKHDRDHVYLQKWLKGNQPVVLVEDLFPKTKSHNSLVITT